MEGDIRQDGIGRNTPHIQGAVPLTRLLRSAKVVCQTGEYPCLIRQASELGIVLKFLHPCPSEPRIILQLTNELTYPLERLWTSQSEAGYRFGSDISIEEFLYETSTFEHRPVRLNVTTTAKIIDGRNTYDVHLADLSREGAGLAFAPTLRDVHLAARLVSLRIDGLGEQLAEIAWQDNLTAGLRFLHPLSLQQLADVALSLHPLVMPAPDRMTAALANARAA